MLMSYRRFRRTYLRPALVVLAFFFVIDALRLVYQRAPPRRIVLKPGARQENNTSVYIASIHRNTERIQRAIWNKAVLNLVDYLGPANVHVSAVESGSQENTKHALMDLKDALNARGVSNDISLGMTVWEQLDEIEARPPPDFREDGWIWNDKEDQWEMRRIPYLARVRNQAMEPLKRLEKEGRRFDKVLWVNDVVFDNEDIATLFDTRNGRYAAACSMDYKLPPLYYDTFALRDDKGLKTTSLYWPWFQSSTSRTSAMWNEPIRVESCWNGIVVFDAAPFYTNPPLSFRGVEDSLADLHLEGSECCLIHADNWLASERGVWLNPNVRVAYDVNAYRKVKEEEFPGAYWIVVGAWINRVMSWRTALQTSLERRFIHKRLQQWAAETPKGERPRFEPGEHCLINEMQIMWSNGWKHL